MIELFPANQTDFSKLGIALHPSVCTVYQEAGGRYDVNITIPYNDNGEHLLPQQDMILRIPVPPHTIGPINLGTVSYYTTTASTPMYSKLGYSERVKYDTWQWSTNYTAGTYVTYNQQNYKCLTSHNSSTDGMIPGREHHTGANVWETASNYRTVSPRSAGTLASGTTLQKLADVNKDYALFATTSGANGYVLLSKVQATGSTTTRTIAQRNITVQLFRIDQVTLSLANRTVQIHAMHISYDMERKPVSSCVLCEATPQTALAFLQGAMLADDDRLLATDIDDTTITVDWSWLNSLNAIMAPNDGLVALTHGKLIRDDNDIFVLSNEDADPIYAIRYGANMRGVNWKRDTGKIYTRVYPKGKDAKGNDLFLPEGYIATSGPEPVIRTQILQVDAQVGQQVEKPDGTVVKLTESDVITLLRGAATERFTKDLCDQPVVTLEVEFLFLGDTAEYAQYKGLEKLHLYDFVRVTDTPDGLDQVAQVTGYRWDALRLRYERVTVGNPHDYTAAGVSGYQLGTGSVSLRSLNSDVLAKLEGQSTNGGGSNYDSLLDQVIQVATDTNNNATAITLKVSKGDVSTELAVECGNVSITGGNLVVSGYVKASELETDIANISYLNLQGGYLQTFDFGSLDGNSISAAVGIIDDLSTDALTAAAITLDGTSIAPSNLVASIGPASVDSGTGGVSIPWAYADGSSGTPITFNVASTAVYQQAVAAAEASGWSGAANTVRINNSKTGAGDATITLTSGESITVYSQVKANSSASVYTTVGTVTITAPTVTQRTATAISTITLTQSDTGSSVSKNVTVSYNDSTSTANVPVTINASQVWAKGYSDGYPASIAKITLAAADTGTSTKTAVVTIGSGSTANVNVQIDASAVYSAGVTQGEANKAPSSWWAGSSSFSLRGSATRTFSTNITCQRADGTQVRWNYQFTVTAGD